MKRAILLLLGLTNGCVLPAPNANEIHPGGRDVSLRFEGTCSHLACRSSYAQAAPANTLGAFACTTERGAGRGAWFTPAFTCDPNTPHRYRQPSDPPYLMCDDRQRWLSLPELTQAECGESYLVCYRGVRTLAVARDRSAPNTSGRRHFEGSLGLLQAIGADPEQRGTVVSIYALHERERIAADPQCVGSGR